MSNPRSGYVDITDELVAQIQPKKKKYTDNPDRIDITDELIRDIKAKRERTAGNDPGFIRNMGKLAYQGAERLVTDMPLGASVSRGEFSDADAGRLEKALTRDNYRPRELAEAEERLSAVGDDWDEADGFAEKAASLGKMLWSIGKEAATNPKGMAYFTAEQAANMVPAIAGMIGGAKLGALTGPGAPVAVPVMAYSGAVAGGMIPEMVLEVSGFVADELKKRGLDPTEQNIHALISDPQISADIIGKTRRKALGTASVDAAFTLAGGKVAGRPLTRAMRHAEKTGTKLVHPPVSSRIAHGLAGGAVDVTGEMGSEATGQLWATGEVDMGEVALEGFGGLGGATVEVPAAARALAADQRAAAKRREIEAGLRKTIERLPEDKRKELAKTVLGKKTDGAVTPEDVPAFEPEESQTTPEGVIGQGEPRPDSVSALREDMQARISTSSDPKAAALETFRSYANGGMTLAQAFELKKELVQMMPDLEDDLNRIIIEAEGNKAFASSRVDPEAAKIENFPPDSELYDLNTQADIDRLFEFKSKQFGSKRKYLESDEYRQAYPVIQVIYRLEKENKNRALIEAGKQALKEEGLENGHRVVARGIEGVDGPVYGRLVFTGKKPPYVVVSMYKEHGLPKTMPWHTDWKKYAPDLNVSTRENTGLTDDEIDFILSDMLDAVRHGEGGGAKGVDNVTGDLVFLGSSYPDWFRQMVDEYPKKFKQSLTAAEVIATITNVRRGRPLADKQMGIYSDLLRVVEAESSGSGLYSELLEGYRRAKEGEKNEIKSAIERVDGGEISDVEERLVGDIQEKVGEERDTSGLTDEQEEAALAELTDFFANVSAAADEIEAPRWVRGERQENQAGDLFFSSSVDVAAEYGDVREMADEERPKNTLVVSGKPELAELIGYDGDPLAESLDLPKEQKFDYLAKQYAQSKGYDSIQYESGTFDEPELVVFKGANKRNAIDLEKDQANIPGASAAETFTLTNPETEVSGSLPQQPAIKNTDLFGQEGAASDYAAAGGPSDLSGKSTSALVGEMFDIINEHLGERGSFSTKKSELDETLYQKLKPYLSEIVRRAKEKALDAKAYLFGAVDAMPDGKAKEIYEAAASRYVSEPESSKSPDEAIAPFKKVAGKVAGKIKDGAKFTRNDLFAMCDKAFGGTLAEGRYSAKDAYDALEMGVNLYISEQPSQFILHGEERYSKSRIRDLKEIAEIIPTQTTRTAEMDEFQQFSTPPHLAYVANWVANLSASDVYLEPSAGTGGLAVFGKLAGVKETIVNELSPRRSAILKALGFDRVFTENAEQLNNILPKDARPTVVVMNPPFSSTAGRIKGQRKTTNAAVHIEQALKRLQIGGRLVAIVGQGMAHDAATFKPWFEKLGQTYSIRANIGIDGREYAKYGTTFDNRILVIDKPAANKDNKGETVTGRVAKVEDLIDLLEGVRNERENTGEQSPGEPSEQKGPGGTKASHQPGTALLFADDDMGARPDRRSGRPPKKHGPGNAELETGKRDEISDNDGRAADQSSELVEGKRSGRPGPGASVNPKRSTDVDAAGLSEQDVSAEDVAGLSVEQRADLEKHSDELSDSVYDQYKPAKLSIPGAQDHPGKLVESAAMASVEPVNPTYSPKIPERAIKSGAISIAQLEAVVYAGQAHNELLPDGSRRGFFIGDGTGVGKGREIASILWDNWNHGRKKHVWLSQNTPLLKDAERDVKGVGWDKGVLFDFGKIPLDAAVKQKEGIAFVGYGTLRSKRVKEGRQLSRLNQLVSWLGEDFDGVIVFDEAHNMGNALSVKTDRGKTKASETALTGIELQRALPNARVLYVSATGATEVMNLAYAERLGLWGDRTPFPKSQDFVTSISAGGITAMEMVAMNLKASGSYMARSLAYDDITVDRLTHELTPEQRTVYDELAGAWQIVQRNIEAAMAATHVVDENGVTLNSDAKAHIRSALWGTNQRFWNQIVTAMQMPSLISALEKDLAAGRAPIIQLVNTNEAAQERAIGRIEEDDSLEDLDITPREMLMEYIQNSFPVNQYEIYEDDDGNRRSRLVVDSAGNPVLNQEAVEMRDELLNRLGSIRVPDGPLEIIMDHFGVDNVAEVTGRTRRVVYKDTADGRKRVIEPWGKNKSMADADAFMEDRKKILVFSQAGGTGRSYHADNTAKNRRKRRHYVAQAGWRADSAVQGLGRSHRTNQAQAPDWILVSTDLDGQKRFISTIARRLSQLGALTRGSRDTGNQGLFSARDNLESTEAKDAWRQLIEDIYHDEVPGITMNEFVEETGMDRLIDDTTGALNKNLPEITQFLNRILNLKIERQNALFGEFAKRLNIKVAQAIENGTLDVGVETIRAKKTEKVDESVVHEDVRTGAKATYIEVELTHDAKLLDFEGSKGYAGHGYVKNVKSGRVWALATKKTRTDSRTGDVKEVYVGVGANYNYHDIPAEAVNDPERYQKIEGSAETLWNADLKAQPKEVKERVHMITGAILPVWDRLPTGAAKIYRLNVDGRNIIGRVIEDRFLADTLNRLGAQRKSAQYAPEDVFDKVLNHGFVYTLSNNWEIRRRKVAGEHRIELEGASYFSHFNELQKYGVFSERIQYITRLFIPTEKAAGVNAIAEIISSRPIVSAQGNVRKAGDVSGMDAEVMNDLGQYSVRNDALRYMNKKKSRAWSVTSGLQLPTVRGSKLGSDKKILFEYDLVKPQYSTEDQAGAVPMPTIDDVKKVFTGQDVTETDKGFIVKTKSGSVLIEGVDRIDADTLSLKIGYGKSSLSEKDVIAGKYRSGLIQLVRGAGDKYTLAHESVHFMEDIGVLNSLDVAALKGRIKRLTREGKFEPQNKDDIGGAEDRAEFIATALNQEVVPSGTVGRIIARVREFIDRIINAFGIRTAGGIVRDIKTGRIWGKQIDNTPERAYNHRHESEAKTGYVSDATGDAGRIDTGGNAALSSYRPNVVGREKAGFITGSGRKITTPRDVARIASNYLGKYPDENFLSFVLDGKDKILHVYRHTIGTRGRADADAGTILGEALNTPGAKSIIMVHQHPSQTPALSNEDRTFYREVIDLARGSEIEVLDGLAVTRTHYSSYLTYDDAVAIEPQEGVTKKIPLVGRVYQQVHNGEKISSSTDAALAVRRYVPNGGTLLLDGNHAVAGFIDLSDYRTIRGKAQTELLKNLETRNARAMIIYSPTREIDYAEARNAAAFARIAGQRLLDIIGPSGAMSEKGGIPAVPIGAEFYSLGSREGIRKHQDPPASKDPKVLNLYLKDETDAIVQTILNKLRPQNMTWLETILKSPEWMDHPQISKIVRLFVRDRNEIYHETFNELNAVAQPKTEGETVASAAQALKNKGLTLRERVTGKASKEYQQLEHFLDYFDTQYKRNPKKTIEENLKDCENYMRDNGASDDVVRVWRLYRDSYDKALDVQTREMRRMIADIIAEAAEKGTSPDLDQLKDTLKGALAQMEQWRGFYAPRIRETGDWKVLAYKGDKNNKEWYRDHRGSELAARRLAKNLERDGWKVYDIGRVEKLPEDVYQDTNALATAKLIDAALDRLENKEGFGPILTAQFNRDLLAAVADEIRARGFRSHMMHRQEGRVVKGYIEDPIRRNVLYMNQIASGTAKARVARMAMAELLGEKVKGKLVGGIDPAKEPKEYEVATAYIREQLRNLDASDRVIGIAKSIATFKFLGFNLRSLAVNMTAIVTTAPASIHQYAMGGTGSMYRVYDAIGRAGKDYAAVLAGKKLANAGEQTFLDDVHKKGWDDAQYTRDALGTMEKTHSRVWATMMDASMYLFGKSEQWNRGTTMLAAYRLARKRGLDHAAAAEAAKESSDRAHGVYGRATLPMWAQGQNPAAKIGQMMYIYSKFSHNYLQMLYDLGFKKHNVKAAMFAFLSPIVVAGGAALPFKDTIFAVAGFVLRSLFGEDRDPEKWVWDTIREHLGDTTERVGRHGLTGAAGVDISGSLSIGVGIPRNMLELTGAIGGVADSAMTGGKALMRGQYSKAVESFLPTGLANPIRAAREAREGVSTRANNRVWDERGRPLEPSAGETVARAAGFRSTRQAVLSERTWEGKRQSSHYAELRQSIYQRYRAWLLGKQDKEEHKKIVKAVREYNEKVKDLKDGEAPKITFASMRGQATRMQNAPKAVRANLVN
jgi:predicted RNA methylase